MRLGTPRKIQALQRKLYLKAKQEPDYRFYALYDKVCRADILAHAYALAQSNGGAPGVDGIRFEDIASSGVKEFLAELRQELQEQRYRPQAVLRVMIPKPDGGDRPLGIPTIRDRVVQTAVKLVLEPIFEADFTDDAYGYRPRRSAQHAVRAVHQALKAGYVHVVDADLSQYLETSSYYTPAFWNASKRLGWLFNTLMRRPLRRPRHTCTAWRSPRFTRCKMV